MSYINKEDFKRKLIDEKHFFPAIVARTLEEMPDANVAEIKHGYWRRGPWIDDYNAGGYYLAECNLCRCRQKKASNFCSNCGAKME